MPRNMTFLYITLSCFEPKPPNDRSLLDAITDNNHYWREILDGVKKKCNTTGNCSRYFFSFLLNLPFCRGQVFCLVLAKRFNFDT